MNLLISEKFMVEVVFERYFMMRIHYYNAMHIIEQEMVKSFETVQHNLLRH